MYGGGGNTGATYKNDFIELFNRGGSVVSVAGWSVQYASTAGTFASGTLAASATDRAGNTATASTTFTVIVDASSLCAVTRTLAGKSGDSLCAKLAAAAASFGRGDEKAARAQIGAYVNEVNAQRGKAVNDANATTLIALAGAL